jgi:hypothetical protein
MVPHIFLDSTVYLGKGVGLGYEGDEVDLVVDAGHQLQVQGPTNPQTCSSTLSKKFPRIYK